MHRPLRLTNSKQALVSNYHVLQRLAGVPCGAAIKADGYGLGATEVLRWLQDAGCREFFVSTWSEAQQIGRIEPGTQVAVLHGVGPQDAAAAVEIDARPVLNSVEQVARWKQIAPDRPCDVMIDTGMNRLGLRLSEAGTLAGLRIHTLHSHLACADEDHPLNLQQLARFRDAVASIPSERYSLANSAGIFLGRDYSFDLVRPGLALYGGMPRPAARERIRQVAQLEAQVVQRRTVFAGQSCGYNATVTVERNTEAAVVNIGYADGYWRGFSSRGSAHASGAELPVLGRVSMDLVILDCSAVPELAEGDWVTLDFDLERAAAISGKSQYELLTGLGDRFERVWA